MDSLAHFSFLLIIPSVIIIHLLASPYTKVEESFSIQAIYDLLAHGVLLQNPGAYLSRTYDHLNFRQPVPRSFIGPLVIAGVSRPWVRLFTTGEQVQLLVRCCLGLLNAASLLAFQFAVSDAFGRTAGCFCIVFQASQFHAMYYASRTLPNTFAFALSTLALRYFIKSNFGSRAKRQRNGRLTLVLSTFAGVVLRGELAILVATLSMSMLATRKRKTVLTKVIIPSGVVTAAMSVAMTVSIDSVFWRKFPIWPEWEAFRFNALEGKSSDWGTSPWHYYFTSSIPKLMMNPLTMLLCIPTALAIKSTRRFSLNLLGPLLAYVCIYSVLPHKEWRFITNVIPGLTAVAAAGASHIWVRRSKSWFFWLLSVALVVSVTASAIGSAGLLAISSLNYPGAHALIKLHELADSKGADVYIRLDNLSRQTGATRFLQKDGLDAQLRNTTVRWHYDKTEFPYKYSFADFWSQFDYVLEEYPEKVPGDWETLDVIKAYAGLSLTEGESLSQMLLGQLDRVDAKNFRFRSFVHGWETWLRMHATKGRWPRVRMEPMITILKRR